MKRLSPILLLAALVCGWSAPAWAARQHTVAQVSPTAPGLFDMGSTQTLTMRVTNTANGTEAGERIYEMRFRLNGTCSGTPCTATAFSSATAAPAGWTRSGFSATSVTFRATSWANSIVSGASMDFSLVMVAGTSTQDRSETLRDSRASFTLDTNFSNGVTRTGRHTINNPGSWTLKGLSVTSFQTTDLSNNPVSTITAGTSFRLVMTVRNISTVTLSSIVTSPNPPTATKTGTVTQSLTSTTYSPNPLTLAPGASGTITFTYSTAATDNGTITFSAYARNNTGSATSRTATSNTLTVSGGSFIVSSINVTTPASFPCAYLGQTFTVTMNLRNSYAYAITGVTPTLNPTAAGVVTLVSAPAAGGSIAASGGTLALQWTYQISGGTTGQLFQFSGSATGTASPPGSGSRTTPTVNSLDVKRGGFSPAINPSQTNASSTNKELTWTIGNDGCAALQSISLTLPAGWTYGNDAYSLVNSTDESWSAAGSGPVTFTAPAPANQLPLGANAAYSLVLATPSSTGVYTFDFGTTDADGVTSTRPTTITVNAFNSGTPSPNLTIPGAWREEFR